MTFCQMSEQEIFILLMYAIMVDQFKNISKKKCKLSEIYFLVDLKYLKSLISFSEILGLQ